MPTRVIRDWLSEYKALPDTELNTYANTIRNNEELVDALYDLFDDEVSHEVLDPVCHQMFEFYRSGHPELQRFTLEALPVMIGAYLTAHSQNDKKRCGGIEACMLGVYNLEVISKDGKPKTKTYTIPTLAVPSVYHEPPSLATLALTESALLRYHSEEHIKITVGPSPQVERIHSQNRLMTLTYVMNKYNADIANMSPRSHYALCKMASSVCKTGFNNTHQEDTESSNLNDSSASQYSKRGVQFHTQPRIQSSPSFLVEVLNGIYFAMFNGQAREGIQAIEDIHKRACYELYADVLLVTNAIKNSLQYNPSGQPQDGPMGISIALSPSQGSQGFSKNAITNASFRTKKLPEDIDVPNDEQDKRQSTGTAGSENPPTYDEVVAAPAESDKSTSSSKAGKLPKPLKSIMKKGSSAADKQDKVSKAKKENEPMKREKKGGSLNVSPSDMTDSHSPKNPKHSISMSTGLSANQNNHTGNDVADPSMVGVQVIRSSSSTGHTFQMVDYLSDLKQTNQAPNHKRASSISEDSTASTTQSKGHSRDVSNASNNDGDGIVFEGMVEEEDESIDTAL